MMKTNSAFAGFAAGVALLLVTVAGASAQYAAPGVTLSASGLNGMTCGTFTHLSPMHRDSLVRAAIASGPTPSLSTVTIQPNFKNGTAGGRRDTGAASGTPLSAGALISACEAATPSSTLGDAYSYANSTSGGMIVRRFHR